MERSSRTGSWWCNISSGSRLLFELGLGFLLLLTWYWWYWGRWLFWNCIILVIREQIYQSEHCWVWDHPKVGPGGMVLTPVTINSIRILNAIGLHQNMQKNWRKLRTVLELFQKYFIVSEVFSHCFGSFLVYSGMFWHSLWKLAQAIPKWTYYTSFTHNLINSCCPAESLQC